MKSVSLSVSHPEIAKEWDYARNGDLTPDTVTRGMTKKANWVCSKGHTYTARIDHRCSMHSGCPICANKQALAGYNDLETHYPIIANEWDYSENKKLPREFLPYSNKVVSWICPICKQPYKRKIVERTYKHCACPKCTGERSTSYPEQALLFYLSQVTETLNRAISDRLEIDIFLPEFGVGIEYNGEYYHANKYEQDATKIRKLEAFGLDIISIECGRERSVSLTNIVLCTPPMASPTDAELTWGILQLFNLLKLPTPDVDLRRDSTSIYSQYVRTRKQYNLATEFPQLAKEWDYIKNKNIPPDAFFPGSNKLVWWICPVCNSSYDMRINNRTQGGSGCPYCAGKRIMPGLNDLPTTHPELINEWDYERNAKSPNEYSKGSDHKAHWLCHKCGHRWSATISSRTQGCGCPVCAGRTILPGYNDFQTLYPEAVVLWNYEKNANLLPTQFAAHSNKKVWWKCTRCNHEWQATISHITRGRRCPECAKRNRTTTRAQTYLQKSGSLADNSPVLMDERSLCALKG